MFFFPLQVLFFFRFFHLSHFSRFFFFKGFCFVLQWVLFFFFCKGFCFLFANFFKKEKSVMFFFPEVFVDFFVIGFCFVLKGVCLFFLQKVSFFSKGI